MIGDNSRLPAFGQQSTQFGDQAFQLALEDFRSVRKRAAVAHLLGRLTGKSLELLSFNEVTQKLKETGRYDRGLQEIPVKAIVGSVGRTSDFDREFSPLHQRDAERWARVKVAGMGRQELPPIAVYKIGDSYFVSDGNHRVSIARQEGVETISAMVIEVVTRAPLPADAQPEDLILGAEQADFLEYTRLDKVRPEAEVRLSVPGQYEKLLNHIAVHRCFLEANQAQICRTVPEAASYWYDETYLPLVETIRERGILRDFPGWTEADLYLWITENQEKLREELGWSVKPLPAINNLADEIGRGSWPLHIRQPKQVLDSPKPLKRKSQPGQQKWMEQRYLNRYSHYLFTDILVPVAWNVGLRPGLEEPVSQALVVAAREGETRLAEDQVGAQLLGLAVIEGGSPADDAAAQTIREAFERLCREAGVDGALAVEEGDAASKISERAILADLIVLDRRFLPAGQDQEKEAINILRSLKQADRPVLLAREWASPLERILLALNGKAEFGPTLFLATYLAEQWGSELIVLGDTPSDHLEGGKSSKVGQYLAMHELEAPILFPDEPAGHLPAAAIVEAANAQACDLIVMDWPATGRIFGRASSDIIELLLDNCQQPILICP